MNAVHLVVPDGVDDPRHPSGGNLYDRRLRNGLQALGWTVHEDAVPGSWRAADTEDTDTGDADRARLAWALARMPEGAPVLVDGLIASVTPRELVKEAGRLLLVVLVHMVRGGSREREALGAATAIVATSAWTKERLTGLHGLPAERIHVALPGADPAAPAEGTPTGGSLLCVGAVTPDKGQDILIDALTRITGPDWRCTFVGALDLDAGFVDTLRRRCRTAGLTDRVRFTGALAGAPLDASFAQADLLVLASRTETFGIVVVEALARGMPVIAGDVGGLPEALGRAPDGSLPGVLVPREDPDALADAIGAWLTDPVCRQRMRASASARRAGLTGWSRTAQEVAAVLDGLPATQ